MRLDFDISRYENFEAAHDFCDAFQYTSNFSHAYSFGVFLTLSGHLIGRQASIWNRKDIHPLFFTTLIGDSGKNRKSTIAEDYGINSLPEDIGVLTSLSSTLGLIKELEVNDNKLLVYLDELSALLSTTKREYANELMEQLFRLYACPRQFGNHSAANRIVIANPFVSILACTTTDMMETTLTTSHLMGGLGNRMMWVMGDPRPNNEDPIMPTPFSWEPLLSIPQKQYFLEYDAKELWAGYEAAFYDRQDAATPILKVLAERLPEKIMKTALVQAVWEQSDCVDARQMRLALEWGDYLYQCLELLAPVFEPLDRRVLSVIKQGVSTRSALYHTLGHKYTNKQLRDALEGLRWSGQITSDNNYITLTEKEVW